jgi:hypothetical protein
MSKARHLRAAPRIERRRPTRSPKPSIIVVCEGGKTEVEYLNEFTADHGNHLVDLQTIGGVGVPETIVDRAIDEHRRLSRYARRKGADSYDGAFSVWAMFDVDAHPKVIEARTRALSNSIRVAFSNPCIELWALLHFSDSDGPLSRSEAQDRLRRFMPDYHHSSNPVFNYGLLRDNYDHAARRAQNFITRREQERNSLGNPCSTVYQLLEEIRQFGVRLPGPR